MYLRILIDSHAIFYLSLEQSIYTVTYINVKLK